MESEESQGQTERTDFPLIRQKYPESDGERKSLHPGPAELLRDSEHEDNHAGLGWAVAPPNPYVHMETMEATENEGKESDSAWHPGLGCLQIRQLSQRLLAIVGGQQLSREQSQTKDSHMPDTTASLTGTSLCTYAIEPPCTERYARWCERSGLFSPSYSILRTVHLTGSSSA